MKRYLLILWVVLATINITTYANETYETSIALCYGSNAYAVDYVFEVQEDVNILSVTVSNKSCIYDWNHSKNEGKLYLSIASGYEIEKSVNIAVIVTDKEVNFLKPLSVVVNGKTKENVFAYHTAVTRESFHPTFDASGCIGGEKCENCGIVLKEPE